MNSPATRTGHIHEITLEERIFKNLIRKCLVIPTILMPWGRLARPVVIAAQITRLLMTSSLHRLYSTFWDDEIYPAWRKFSDQYQFDFFTPCDQSMGRLRHHILLPNSGGQPTACIV